MDIKKIKKIINYEIVKKGKDTLQKKAFKALIAFIILMIMCTIFSRFANSLTIPVVKTDNPKVKTMVDELKAEGRIVKNREDKIGIIEGLKVEYVNVNIGSTIKKDDVIVELNVDDLKTKIDAIKESIASEQKTLNRATEDYNSAIARKETAANKAYDEMDAAYKALEDYKASSNKDEMMEQTLLSDYEMKKSAYEQALADYNNNVDLERALQDVKDSLKLDEHNANLAKLQPLLDAGGKVTSPQDGVVTNIFAENGGVTTDTIISLANEKAGFKFIGQISKEHRSKIKQGQAVTVSLQAGGGTIENLAIESISRSSENPEMLDISVTLPIGIGEIDDIGEAIISSKSKKFGTCVPLKALRQGDGNSYYVLVVSEKDTVLGTEKVAKKIEVRVEKKDGEFAALNEGAIARDEVVIVSSNKKIEDGDRVRLETE